MEVTMKRLFIIALVTLMILPLMADRNYTQVFTAPFNLNASATATNGTDFTSASINVSGNVRANMALLTMSFTRTAGSATSTVDFYFQVSYDGGTSWADFHDPIADADYLSVIAGHAVLSGTTVRVSRIIPLNGVSHIRFSKVINNDTVNNLTAVNAILSW
jgi:hypothetical protein